MTHQETDTIIALSSGQGRSGIAVVRISGPKSDKILKQLTRFRLPLPRKAATRWLHDSDGVRFDEALVLRFSAPNSFTGEDCAEIHCHGSPAIVEAILIEATRLKKVRLAERGEFSRRAFENGKLDLLQAEGIADRDVQTSSFAIYPQYRQVAPKDGIEPPQEIIGYEVSNTLTLKVRDLEKLGGLIDKTVKLGVNQGGQIEFTNTNTDEVMTQARKAAVAEALAKAKTLTEAAGVKLGRIMEISENSAPPMAPPMMRMTMAKDSGNGVPVAAGETSYTVNVNVVFSIDP